MQDHVFGPAGVQNATFEPLPLAANSALAYAFPPTGFGWNSGNLQTVAGGVGWRLSVNEVLNVMDHFRRRNTILSVAKAQEMMDSGFGLNGIYDTKAGRNAAEGRAYYKKGAWGNAGRTEQAHAFFLPRELELVLFVNSRLFVKGFAVNEVIANLYRNNLR